MAQVKTEREIRRQLQQTSARLYRSGLSKAEAGDLTRAADDLEQAVRYNKNNEDARNLLGLVRFETGELGEALKHWGISLHLNPKDNRASEYMDAIRDQVELLSAMSDALVMYNEALELAQKGELDFALIRLKRAVKENPKYIKAQLLLSLVYIETAAYTQALKTLDEVAKVDPMNPDALKYRLYIAAQRKDGAEDTSVTIRDLSNDIFVQNALPEPEMKTISSRASGQRIRGSAQGVGMQILLMVVGLILGIEFMALLYVPNKLQGFKEETRKTNVTIANLEKEVDDLSAKMTEAKDWLSQIGVDKIDVTEEVRTRIRDVLDSWGE